MSWQDDPIATAPPGAVPPGAAPAQPVAAATPPISAASTGQPDWRNDPVMPSAVAAVTAAPPESALQRADQQLTAEGYKPPAAIDWLEKNIAEPLSGFSEQAQRAASFGLTDKISAAVPALNAAVARGIDYVTGQPEGDIAQPGKSLGDIYQSELAAARGEGDTYAANHPFASKLATTLGTVGATAPAGAMEAAAANLAANKTAQEIGLSRIPLAFKSAAAAPATLAGRVGQGVVGGATIGGLSGFGNSNDKSVGSDLLATGAGAGLGATVGGAVPAAVDKVVGPIWQWAARTFGPQSVTENQALARLAQRVAQDKAGGGPGAQDILDAINAAPANEKNVIADFGGGNVLGEAGRVVRAPGPGKTVGLELLTNRAKGEPETVAGLVQSGLSPNGGSAFSATQALIDARAAAAAPKYEAAGIPSNPALYPAAPVVDNPAVTRLLEKSAAVKSAIAQAKNLPDYADLPDNSIVMLDKVYKNIGGSAAEASQAGNGEAARDLNNLRIQLRDAITGGDPNHPYQQALNAYSGPSASLKAIDAGRRILAKSPSQIAEEVRSLAPGDAEFYKLGAADTLVNSIESTGRTGNPATRIAQNLRAQNQLRPLFDSDEAFNNFIDGIDRANRRMETKLATIGNSASAGRIAEDEAGAAANPALAGAAEATAGALTGESIPVGTGLWNMVRGLSTNRPPQSPEVNEAIARMLFNDDPAANRATLAAIIARQNRPMASKGAIVPLASLAGAHPGTALAVGISPARSVLQRLSGDE